MTWVLTDDGFFVNLDRMQQMELKPLPYHDDGIIPALIAYDGEGNEFVIAHGTHVTVENVRKYLDAWRPMEDSKKEGDA